MVENKLSLTDILSFSGKRVLITGASSGIGRAVAIRFAEAGAFLITVDRSVEEEVPEYLSKAAGVKHYQTDLGKKEEIDKLWAAMSDDELPDILINNAGIYPMKQFEEIDQEFMNKVIDINMNSMLWMCQAFISRRGNQGGIIVNTSSIEAQVPFTKDLIHYGMSKAGVIALTRGIAREYGGKGFRANVIMPGGIMTEGTNAKTKDIFLHFRFDLIKTGIEFQKRLANGVWGQPDDIAKVTLFLASDMASYVQGAVVPVDGGFLVT